MNNSFQQMMQIVNSPVFKILSGSKTPQQAVQALIKANPQFANNEIFNNAAAMMSKGDLKGVETMARNLVNNAGGNPDQLFQMLNNMNIK